MLALILLFAIAYACARAIENGMDEVSAKHKKRIKKTAKKKGRRTGAKLAAWAATGATATVTFAQGFKAGWQREWPKARKRAATKFGRNEPEPELETAVGDDIGIDGAPASDPAPAKPAEPAGQAAPLLKAPSLVLVKNDEDPELTDPTQPDTTTGDPMSLATIPEVTGVSTLKQAVARYASEAGVTAEEAGALAQRAAQQLAAIEATIEQASALEFGDDDGTMPELYALRDQYSAALAAAQALQKAAVDNAAIASQSSKNIHDRHSNIQEAVAARGGRMAAKQAYTADA